MWIKDNEGGYVHEYGTNRHDSLVVSGDGRTLSYYNLQNGDGSKYGGYVFCDEDGLTPAEIPFMEDVMYANSGGFGNVEESYAEGYEQAKADIITNIIKKKACMIEHGIEQYKIDGLDALIAVVKHTNLPHSDTKNEKG